MSRVRTLVLVALGAAVTLFAVPAAGGQIFPGVEKRDVDQLAPHVPGEVLVRLKDGVSAVAARKLHLEVSGSRHVQRVADSSRLGLARLAAGRSVAGAIARYEADPRVRYAEPNYLYERTLTVNDALFPQLWGLHNTGQSHGTSDAPIPPGSATGTADDDMDVAEAWDDAFGSGVVVAVIDDGVDVDHPDLANQLWTNPGDPPGGGDNDGNGLVDDVHGWDFANNDNTLLAPNTVPGGNTHGTHVAGTIAAQANNSIGVAGVCPACEVMVLKVMTDGGTITTASLVKALKYARQKGAKVVNMSLGGPGFSSALRAEIRKSPFLAVVAASNDSLDNDMALTVNGTSSPSYPASFTLPNILAVAASNDHDEWAYHTDCEENQGFSKAQCAFSNWGHDSVDVAAPGVDIASTVTNYVGPGDPGYLGSGYALFNGTSMATPNTAGVAGLLRGERPGLSAAQTKHAIMRGVDKPNSLRTLRSSNFGSSNGSFLRTDGRVNADKALTGGTTNPTPTTDGNIDGAKSMNKNTKKGSIAWPEDINDLWKRKLAKGKYRLTLTGPSGRDYDLLVWKPGTKEIWQFAKIFKVSADATANEQVTFTVTRANAKKTYYFQVTAWLGSRGNYTLKLKKL